VIDARLAPVLLASMSRIQAAMAAAVDKTAQQLGLLAASASSNAQRQLMMTAEMDLQSKSGSLRSGFQRELKQRTNKEIEGVPSQAAGGNETNWDTLSLVEHAEVDRTVLAERLALGLSDECQAQLKALQDHVAPLLEEQHAEHLPLRPQVLCVALLESLSEVSEDADVVNLLAQHIVRNVGPELGKIYEQTVADLRARGVQAQTQPLVRRPGGSSTVSPANSLSGGFDATQVNTTPGALNPQASATWAETGPAAANSSGHAPWQAHQRAARALGEMFGMSVPEAFAGSRPGEFNATHPSSLSHPGAFLAASPAAANEFNHLVRRLNTAMSMTTGPGTFGGGGNGGGGGDYRTQPGALEAAHMAEAAFSAGFAGPMMAVNMIRAHRDELVRASGGAPLDQMVIDIVAALFDQVLSDPKVSPQMARQIARLQLPVLRVALQDMGFFNSRKHPVRRFVNRIATLSATFDDPDTTAGQACLARVKALVDEVVDGDFDSVDVYASKLGELEAFVDAQSSEDSAEVAAVEELLSGKEADLRVHQRYMIALKRELAAVEMPEFVREFLTDIWSQVQVMSSARHGRDSALAERMRHAGRELALSVQPRGQPQLRKDFLVKLPQLMKDLTEGLALIQWAEDAKQAFFAKLLPAHAESLKTQPQHDLTRRLLEQQLSKVAKLPIPSRDEAANDSLPDQLEDIQAPPALTVVNTLSAEEIRQTGFVPEAAVMSQAPLDIDLDVADAASAMDVDINLDAPPPPSAGLQLVHHIIKGTAYQMQMDGEWKRVRLTWISEGRTFFIFTQGHQHKRTISLTARTVARMCDTGRFKAFEPAELIERATLRARRQLAALGKTASAA